MFISKASGSRSVPGGCKVLVVENVFTKGSRKDVAAPLVGVAQWLKYALFKALDPRSIPDTSNMLITIYRKCIRNLPGG